MSRSALPAPRWITFDCYGTLIDWESGIRRSFREIIPSCAGEEGQMFAAWERIQRAKIKGPYSPYAQIVQESFREVVAEFGYRSGAHASDSFLESLARWEPFPDVATSLVRLAKRRRLAVISNTDRELLGWTLRQFPVRFDALVTAEDARAYKPDPQVFRYALAKLDCSPQDVVHVAFGAEYDLQPAAATGLRIVYLNRGRELSAENLPLEASIGNLTELDDLWAPGPHR